MHYQSVWDKNLTRDERILHEFSISSQFRNLNLLLAGLISIPLLFAWGLGLLTFLIAWFMLGFYLKKSNAYCLTNRRLIVQRGWLSTKTISVDYNRITDVIVHQNFFEWLLYKTGTLFVNTAGLETHEVTLPHLADPYALKKKIFELMDQAQPHHSTGA